MKRFVFDEFCCESNEKDGSGWRLQDTGLRVLLYHFDKCHAIMRSHLVEETKGMILGGVATIASQSIVTATTATESQGETTRTLRSGSIGNFVLKSLDCLFGYGKQVCM